MKERLAIGLLERGVEKLFKILGLIMDVSKDEGKVAVDRERLTR